MTSRVAPLLTGLGLTALVAGCGGAPVSDQAQFAAARPESGTQGEVLGAAGLGTPELDDKNRAGQTGIGVNEYLWRGALETLSFMPLASADPFGGVIITDWFQPPTTPSERFKATAYILGRELRADGVRVAIFRQTMQDGQWVNADVAPSTVSEIEDKILTRARELRARAG
jgi:hypothetical protein